MIVGIDLGSRRTAVAAARSSMPLHVAAAHTIDVNPAGHSLDDLDVQPAVDEAIAIIDCAKAEQVVVEHQAWYPARGKSPQALMAMQKANRVCEKQKDALLDALQERGYRLHDYKAIDWGKPLPVKAVFIVPRIAWACRAVPHTPGRINDADAWEGLRGHIVEGAELLEAENIRDVQDKRDAVGCTLAVLLPPARKRRKARPSVAKPKPTAEERETRKEALRAKDAARKARERGKPAAEEREASGECACGSVDAVTGKRVVRRHRAECTFAKGHERDDGLDRRLRVA